MILTPQNVGPVINGLFTDFKTQWRSAYDAQPIVWDKFAMTMPSSTRQNLYAWLDHVLDGGLREWLGERQFENLSARDYILANRKYERSIRVKRDDIEDDNYALYAQRSAELGRQAKAWQDRQLAALIANAHLSSPAAGIPSGLAFDGQPFFSTAHPIDPDNASSSTYSNYDASGKALNSANLKAALEAGPQILGRDGNPLGIRWNVLMVPAGLELTAAQILNTTYTAPVAAVAQNAANVIQENVLKGVATYFVNPYLTDQAAWYLLDLTKGILPFIFQSRIAPEFQYLEGSLDYNVFLRDEYLMGVRARGAFGVSLPFLAYKGKA